MSTMSAAAAMPGRCHGVGQIVRFNWPFYVTGAIVAIAAWWVARTITPGGGSGVLPTLAAALASAWLLGSLVVSWIVYDLSPLMRATWIPRALGRMPRQWVAIHAGFDEFTPKLRTLFGAAPGRSLDIFDAREMSEASIARARRARSAPDADEAADFRRLPLPDRSADAVLLLASAHELRSREARRALFGEVHRVLAVDGRVIVAEHLRDWANAAAFGPGALHFHSRRTWIDCFEASGFSVAAEFSMTPFVRVFVLGRKP
jgi:SAM-dependent methyltransferase